MGLSLLTRAGVGASRGEVLPERTVKQLCDKLKEQLIYESNVLSLSSPLTVVGDLHGFAPPPTLPSSPSPP
jgi:hypothetical protein